MISYKDITIPAHVTVSTYKDKYGMTQITLKGEYKKAVLTHFKGQRVWAVAFFDSLSSLKAAYLYSNLSKADAYGNAVDYVAP
jgi:hypothetical protein